MKRSLLYGRRLSVRARIICAIACVAWIALAITSSLKKSASIDEVPHIAAGLSALHCFDFRMNPEHPPLIKMLATLPAYLFYRPDMRVDIGVTEIAAWYDGLQSQYGYYLLFHTGRDPNVILLLCRLVPVLIGLGGAFVAYRMGKTFSRSAAGGLIAAALLMIYPEYIGHARFVTFDVPMVVACGAVSWAAYSWWRLPQYKSALLFVLVTAVASQVKLPVTVFIVVTLFVILALTLLRRNPVNSAPRHALRSCGLLIVFSGVAIYTACWASSGFRFSYLPAGAIPPINHNFIPPVKPDGSALASIINTLWGYRILPETTLATLSHVGSFTARDVFLFGEHSLTGWYYYFLVSTALKTSIFYLVALVASAIWLVSRIPKSRCGTGRVRIEQWILFLVPYVMLFALFSHSRANIGHRYVLFMYLPYSVVIATAVAAMLRARGTKRLVATGFLVTQIAICVVTFPHYETYFNELVRTPYNGLRYLRDSNIDWGQDLPIAAEYLEQLEETKCNYAAFGYNRPQSFGISNFNWLLYRYPFAMYMPEATKPDPNLFSIISLNALPAVRGFFPELYNREPYEKLNSMVIYLPYNLYLKDERK